MSSSVQSTSAFAEEKSKFKSGNGRVSPTQFSPHKVRLPSEESLAVSKTYEYRKDKDLPPNSRRWAKLFEEGITEEQFYSELTEDDLPHFENILKTILPEDRFKRIVKTYRQLEQMESASNCLKKTNK